MSLLPFEDSELPGFLIMPLTLGFWIVVGVGASLVMVVAIILFVLGGKGIHDEFLDGLLGHKDVPK